MSNKRNSNAFFLGTSYYHRVRIFQPDGTIKYAKKGGFKTAEEAERSYKQYEEDFTEKARSYYISCARDKEVGFKDYLICWFEDTYSKRVENTTRMIGSYTLYQLILPHMIKDCKLKYLNVDYLNELIKLAAGNDDNAGHAIREFIMLALKDAVIQGYLPDNPVKDTKNYPRKKATVMVLGKEKLKLFLKMAKNSPWYLEILLGLFVGLRKGEIYGLKFDDIDFENELISINRQLTADPKVKKGQFKIESYEVKEKPPKKNSYRSLKVPPIILEEIKKRRELIDERIIKGQGKYCEYGYISCQENGEPHAMSSFNAALAKICKKNGLPHITVHSLRHMYATILSEKGVPLIKISALLGHSSIKTTFDYYCELMDEGEKMIDFVNGRFPVERGDDND